MTCQPGSSTAAGMRFTSAGARGACCWRCWLLPAVRACCLLTRLVALTSVIRTTTTAPSAVASKPPATATAVAGHLGETGVDLLLGLLEDVDKIPGLLGVCEEPLVSIASPTDVRVIRPNLLSVVKNVMAVPLAPARPVRPILWM